LKFCAAKAQCQLADLNAGVQVPAASLSQTQTLEIIMYTNLKTRILLAAHLVLAPVAAPASAKQVSSCSLVVGGQKFIGGPCEFAPQGSDGSFMIKKNGYFAIVSMDGDKSAEGYWNEDKGANHAHSGLGSLNSSRRLLVE
jgi:hypothetical protein